MQSSELEKNLLYIKNSMTIVIFYTEILMRKIVLWSFFMSETNEKKPQFNFSSQNLNIERHFFK